MADFHHLLEEVDEALHQEEQGDDEEEVATLDASASFPNTTQQSTAGDDNDDNVQEEEEWDGDREELQVPAALEELARKQRLHGAPGDEEEEEEDNDVQDEDLLLGDDAGQVKEDTATQSYRKLKKLWQQEVACPELLPLDEDMVEEITQQLERREEAIGELAVQAGDVEALMESIMKVDMDRAKFMLSDLFRTRLSKIQEHPLHMRDLIDRMSDPEIDFLRGYGQLVENHLRRTVLDHLAKDALKNLDEPDMIDRPNLDQYVFVKVKETAEIKSGTDDEPSVEHPAGTTLITRYSVVRELFVQGKVELFL